MSIKLSVSEGWTRQSGLLISQRRIINKPSFSSSERETKPTQTESQREFCSIVLHIQPTTTSHQQLCVCSADTKTSHCIPPQRFTAAGERALSQPENRHDTNIDAQKHTCGGSEASETTTPMMHFRHPVIELHVVLCERRQTRRRGETRKETLLCCS